MTNLPQENNCAKANHVEIKLKDTQAGIIGPTHEITMKEVGEAIKNIKVGTVNEEGNIRSRLRKKDLKANITFINVINSVHRNI